MPDKNHILAIFDFDGTLTEGHLWKGIAKHHQQKKIKRWSLFTYLASHIPFWLASKIGLYSVEKNRVEWGEDLAVLFKGMTAEQSKEVFEWVTVNYFLPLMRSNVLDILREHKAKGHEIILLSGMFVDFLEVVGGKIGADYVQGTKLEKTANVNSGKIIQPLCFGVNKAKLLTELIRMKNIDADLTKSYAYADSSYDIPVFDLVGNPVAVYPDKKLLVIATNKNWKIIGIRNNKQITS
jgi:HAD superfamily hydrolase (TIGR01490 family)